MTDMTVHATKPIGFGGGTGKCPLHHPDFEAVTDD